MLCALPSPCARTTNMPIRVSRILRGNSTVAEGEGGSGLTKTIKPAAGAAGGAAAAAAAAAAAEASMLWGIRASTYLQTNSTISVSVMTDVEESSLLFKTPSYHQYNHAIYTPTAAAAPPPPPPPQPPTLSD